MLLLRSLILFLLLNITLLGGSVNYGSFVSSQMSISERMNEDNATQESIEVLLKEQNTLYDKAVHKIMAKKEKYLSGVNQYTNEIFAIRKVMIINKRAGNGFALYRDEIALKIYLLLRSQNKMIKAILVALNSENIDIYEERLNEIVATSQKEISSYYDDKEYKHIETSLSTGKIAKLAKENLHELQILRNVNADLISHIYRLSPKMYRLNKYSKYHLIPVVVYINSIAFIEVINPILEQYDLSIIKLLMMLTLIIVIYFFRKVVYVSLELYILKINLLSTYSKEISQRIKGTIESLIIIININMVIYVYLDFSSVDIVTRLFNMLYGFYFTLIIYKVLNTVAKIKLSNATNASTNIKNDLVNVGLKILNFIILVIGLLIMLFFAGVNLTAVLSGLGIGGFAVAFAAKDTISNFFGTLSILFSDVFSQGDWIEIDGHQGVAVEIGLRVTTIRTFDNALIAIPNGTFASKDVKNWDKRILGRRIKMHVGVKYDSKSEDIKNAIEAIRVMLDKHSGIATKATKYSHHNNKSHTAKLVSKDDLEGVKNTLLVYLDEFSDSSINILIYCFSKSVMWEEWLETKEDVMHRIMAILEQNNLEFAFPSLSIYNEN